MKTLCLTCVFGLVLEGTVKGYEGCDDRNYVVTKCTFGSATMIGAVVSCNKYEKEELGKITYYDPDFEDYAKVFAGCTGVDGLNDPISSPKSFCTGLSPWCQCPSCMEEKSRMAPKGWEEW